MSRSGYIDDGEQWDMIRWRGAVTSALRGKRGQDFLRELLAALDALPEKRLVSDELEIEGEVCAIGAVGRARGVDMERLDPEDHEQVAAAFEIPNSLACEIMYLNDDYYTLETPENRYIRMHAWVRAQLKGDKDV